MVIQAPNKSYLYNLKVVPCPSDTAHCTCDQNMNRQKTSRLKYKDCCKRIDEAEKKKVLDEIEEYLSGTNVI